MLFSDEVAERGGGNLARVVANSWAPVSLPVFVDTPRLVYCWFACTHRNPVDVASTTLCGTRYERERGK